MTRAPASVTSSAFLFLILLLSPGEAAALEYDLKITTTAHVGVFPDAQNGGQEDVISSLQVKPDLVIQSDNSWEAVLAPRFRLGLSGRKGYDDGKAENRTRIAGLHDGARDTVS